MNSETINKVKLARFDADLPMPLATMPRNIGPIGKIATQCILEFQFIMSHALGSLKFSRVDAVSSRKKAL